MFVGPKSALACSKVYLDEVNWISEQPEDGVRALVKLRNSASPTKARIFFSRPEQAHVIVVLDNVQYGISSVQVAALYDFDEPDIMLGGGWISKAPLEGFEKD